MAKVKLKAKKQAPLYTKGKGEMGKKETPVKEQIKTAEAGGMYRKKK